MQTRTKPRDARSLDHKTLEAFRRWAVTRVLAGESHRAVADSLDVHRVTVGQGMRWFREGGEVARASTVARGGRGPSRRNRRPR